MDSMLCPPAALGYFIGAVAPNMDVANAALPAYVTVLLFFVGLLLRNQDQPIYWRWCACQDCFARMRCLRATPHARDELPNGGACCDMMGIWCMHWQCFLL